MSLEIINKLPFNKAVDIIIIIVGNIIAPYWYFYHFHPALVAGSDIWKQLIFCLAISLPVAYLGYVGELIDDTTERGKLKSEEQFNRHTFRMVARVSSFFASILYAPVIMKSLTSNLSAPATDWIIAGFVLLRLIYQFVRQRGMKPPPVVLQENQETQNQL